MEPPPRRMASGTCGAASLPPAPHQLHVSHPLAPAPHRLHVSHPLAPAPHQLHVSHPLAPAPHQLHVSHPLAPAPHQLHVSHPLAPAPHQLPAVHARMTAGPLGVEGQQHSHADDPDAQPEDARSDLGERLLPGPAAADVHCRDGDENALRVAAH